ncbi:T9SS type A sorting domain-containing protein [Ichthyenterobacterium magnum]|uniref:Putative secreted protein (Por secretion system target) n=1 Tax=Ichthyenterobacterium magnum TaxID=1230530 RepID=A0A420DLF5_9FLAO|nr:T9SS type A sorting domain-containing protein [Ichthyenterobacterium magnum]RKE95040.1 putative secreted protein (Por secretion system target) [Ichthyenterobacterium magnum]
MKKIISLIIILFLSLSLNAQDGYTYTLSHNGGYSFTISAVPNASPSNFATSVQSYGFTIILTDGITASITSSLGNGANDTFFDGTNVAQPTIDGYLITEVLGSPISLAAPSSGTNSAMVTVLVNGSPTTGSISILANDSTLATTVTALKSFMAADMVDDGMAMFPNVVDSNTSALSGMTSFNFSTLDVNDSELIEFSIYPNPTSDYITIQSTKTVDNVEIYDLLGKLVMSSSKKHIDVKSLSSGAYLVKVKIDDKITVKKIIKE